MRNHMRNSFKVTYMRNKTPPKLARKYPPCKNRIPPAPQVTLCSELACSPVLWSVLMLNKSALSFSAVNCVWFNSLSPITKNLGTCAHLTAALDNNPPYPVSQAPQKCVPAPLCTHPSRPKCEGSQPEPGEAQGPDQSPQGPGEPVSAARFASPSPVPEYDHRAGSQGREPGANTTWVPVPSVSVEAHLFRGRGSAVRAQECLASLSSGWLTWLSCSFPFPATGLSAAPDFSLLEDYLGAGLFSLHIDHLQGRHRPIVTLCDRAVKAQQNSHLLELYLQGSLLPSSAGTLAVLSLGCPLELPPVLPCLGLPRHSGQFPLVIPSFALATKMLCVAVPSQLLPGFVTKLDGKD